MFVDTTFAPTLRHNLTFQKMSQLAENQLLSYYSEKLGIKDPTVIKKTEEYIRILQSKSSASRTITALTKTILCLDLAATQLGIGFDKESAIKFSGLRKTVYQNTFNNIQKILNLDRPLTISELCVQLNCTAAKDTAEKILASYAKNDQKIKDISHPQYVAAAVSTACKLNNLKIQKTQLVSVSHLKRAQWAQLVNEFEKFAESLGLVKGASNKKNKQKKMSEEIDEIAKSKEQHVIEMEIEVENVIEDYEVWRERILKAAYLELEDI